MILLENILRELQPLQFEGKANTTINRVVQLNDNEILPADLLWCSDKNSSLLEHLAAGNVLLSPKAFEEIKSKHKNPGSINWIVVENPRRAFMLVLRNFFIKKNKPSVSSGAVIHSSVTVPANCTIGHGVVIEEGCVIGNEVSIGHNSVILQDTIIEDGVKIGSNCTIGGVGFGYEQSEEGQYELIPHIGNVRICKGAEIGNNTAIDRGVIGTTLIGENVKIDNLVHIAHGVQIGANSLVIAHAMIAGSAELGKNVWISPCASVLQKVKIGDNSIVGMGSVVLKDVPENKVAVGTPAKIIRDNK
jgi:UDP-3-O-[3-hydroxymyristoyl] glucosamine N-acyltransferase